MTSSAIHFDHPPTLLTIPHLCSTLRTATSFPEGTDRWISGPNRAELQPQGAQEGPERRPA